MKRFLCLAIAFVAAAAFGVSEAHAQFNCGGGYYGFHNYGYNFNRSGFERPPHFALYPPVYYSNQIIRRPVGVSPFAAPPGVTPVEMTVKPEPSVVRNPYFKRKARPVTAGKLDNDT